MVPLAWIIQEVTFIGTVVGLFLASHFRQNKSAWVAALIPTAFLVVASVLTLISIAIEANHP